MSFAYHIPTGLQPDTYLLLYSLRLYSEHELHLPETWVPDSTNTGKHQRYCQNSDQLGRRAEVRDLILQANFMREK